MKGFMLRNNSLLQLTVFATLLLICWNIENIAGLGLNYKKWRHAALNAKFIFINFIPEGIMGIMFIKVIGWTGVNHFGLLYHLPYMHHALPNFIMTFILLDLGEYIYHFLMHKFKRLWMFHAVHHCDTVVDVSTTLREHPCENLIRNGFTLIWIFLSGTVLWALVLRQLLQLASNLFAHMNYRLPEKVDSILGILFITPNLHHVHHHYKQPYTDCNYGDVLSIWDRMFGTFCKLPAEKVVFGLDVYSNQNENQHYYPLLKIPFGEYKAPGDVSVPEGIVSVS